MADITKKSFRPVLKIKSDLLGYDNAVEVYKCDSKEEYLDFISFCSKKYKEAFKDDFQRARGDYNPIFKHYAVTEVYGSSDVCTDFILLPLLDIGCKMKWRVKEIREDLDQLEDQLKKVKKLLDKEENNYDGK